MELNHCTSLHSKCDIHTLDYIHDLTLPLNTGSPKFDMPSAVKEAISGNINDTQYLTYPPLTGEVALHSLIATTYRERHGVNTNENQILITSGAMQAVQNICRIEAGDGQDVLLPPPFWFKFPDIVSAAGGVPVLISTEASNNFKLTPELLQASITDNSRLLVITNPNNPTGAIYNKSELQALLDVVCQYPDLKVLSDEVYNELLIGEGQEPCVSIGSLEPQPERVYTVNSMSKNFAMSGLRVGYVIAPQASMGSLQTLQGLTTLGVNAALQSGAINAISNTEQYTREIAVQLQPKLGRASLLVAENPNLSFQMPLAGYYFYLDVNAYMGASTTDGTVIENDEMLANYLEMEARVKVVPGTTCGVPGYFRITFAIGDAELEAGLKAMNHTLNQLTLA